MPPATIARVALLATFVVTAGCSSLSHSSQSVSKIVLSPLKSASHSSSPEDSYSEDVRDLTAAHVRGGGKANELRREIGRVAKQHGVTDWQRSSTTYRAVGAGLKRAGYRQSEVDAFTRNFADTAEEEAWIQKGYDSE